PEDATVRVGAHQTTMHFAPEHYSGAHNQLVVPGAAVQPDAQVVVEKSGRGLGFATATWHFSTDQLPQQERDDFFGLSRRHFRRTPRGTQFVLTPLTDGMALRPGDQVEVQLTLRSKHPAEYVHLRDPRAAGLEPDSAASRFTWQQGLGYYEEVRDSGAN